MTDAEGQGQGQGKRKGLGEKGVGRERGWERKGLGEKGIGRDERVSYFLKGRSGVTIYSTRSKVCVSKRFTSKLTHFNKFLRIKH